MLEGAALRLHKNTLVHIDGEGTGLITGYDAEARRWRVLVGGKTETAATEESLQLRFFVQPTSCIRVHGFVKVVGEEAQGACGRGLIAAQDIRSGYPIVEEPPLIVVRSSLDASPHEHHAERWRAYKMLAGKASAGPGTAWASAKAAFDDLVACEPASGSLKDVSRVEAAAQIAREEAEGLDEEQVRA